MANVDECCHNVALDTICDRCPREGRLVLTMNVLTGYMSQWILPHRERSDGDAEARKVERQRVREKDTAKDIAP